MAKDNTPLSAYFDLYQLALSYEGKSHKTLAPYLANLNQFARHLQEKAGRPPALADFTPDTVMDYIAARKREPKYVGHPFSKVSHQPMSPFTLGQYVRTLKGVRHLAAGEAAHALQRAHGSAATEAAKARD